MKACLDLHDFSVVNNRFDLLLKLKHEFPGFKVTLFTVPIDEKRDWGPYCIRKESLETIKKNLDWIQIVPHGYKHDGWEFYKCDFRLFNELYVPGIKRSFGEDDLPFVNGFCAPHWKWSVGVVKALNELKWWAVDPRQPKMTCTKLFYRYSHCIDESLPKTADLLKLHGHVYGTKNDLGRCLYNILDLPKDTEWHFVTDFLEQAW